MTLIIKHLAAFIFVLIVFGVHQQSEAQKRLFRKASPENAATDTIQAHYEAMGASFELIFVKGKAHNHPLMAIWIEDMEGNYVQTVFIAESIGKGIFRHGDPSEGRWMPGPVRRPAALPYWGHQRGMQADDGFYIPTQDHPMPDGVTGPTPKADFVVSGHVPDQQMHQFRILFEINQSWDWNEYWTNDRFAGDMHYMSSSQPALVYEAIIDLDSDQNEYELHAIGHSHWSGQNGELYENLSTITTALDITESILLKITPR
jgi:hypothetical protein